MSKSNVVVLPLLRALLVGAAVLGLFSTAQAQSRIGVTQATENNPIGKPLIGADRVLKVGTDIQADETVITSANDRAHLIFLANRQDCRTVVRVVEGGQGLRVRHYLSVPR